MYYLFLFSVILTLNLVNSASVNKRKMCNEISPQILGKILGPAYNSRYMSIDLPPEIDASSSQPSGIKRAPSNTPAFYVEDDYSREYGDTPAWETSHLDVPKQISKRDLHVYNYFEDKVKINFEETAILENEERIKEIEDKKESVDDADFGNVLFEKMLEKENKSKANFTNTGRKLKKRGIEYSHHVNDERDLKETPVVHLPGYELEKRSIKPVRQWECQSRIRWLDLGPDYFPRYLRSVECTSRRCWYDMLKCTPRSFTVKLLRRKPDRCVPVERNVGIAGLPLELRELWIWEERAVNFCCDCSTI